MPKLISFQNWEASTVSQLSSSSSGGISMSETLKQIPGEGHYSKCFPNVISERHTLASFMSLFVIL